MACGAELAALSPHHSLAAISLSAAIDLPVLLSTRLLQTGGTSTGANKWLISLDVI